MFNTFTKYYICFDRELDGNIPGKLLISVMTLLLLLRLCFVQLCLVDAVADIIGICSAIASPRRACCRTAWEATVVAAVGDQQAELETLLHA